MRAADRKAVTEPPILKQAYKDGKTELQRASAYMKLHADIKRKRGAFEFARYKEGAVKDALEKLFHGKCAYCESFYAGTQPVDVEHYRPKGEVSGQAQHPGYWWLAMDWENLLPSCIDCNRRRTQKLPTPLPIGSIQLLANGEFDRSISVLSGKDSIFPLVGGTRRASRPADDLGSEGRLLIDPTRDKPDEHLVMHVTRTNPVSLLYPKPLDPAAEASLPDPHHDPDKLAATAKSAGVSAMGLVSIQVYGLNRLGLVQARTKLLLDLEFLLELATNLTEIATELKGRTAATKSQLPGTSGALKKQLRESIATDQKIAKCLERFLAEVQQRFREKADARAPYSCVARAWIDALLKDA